MKLIQAWSYTCAHQLMNKLGENHEKRRVYYYGFQIIIGGIVKGIMLVAIAWLLGALLPTLMTLLFFSSLRMIAGGYHMNTYGKCITASLSMLIIPGVIAGYTSSYWPMSILMAMVVLTFVIALYGIIKWVPADTPNRPIEKPEEIRKFKRMSQVHIFIWLGVMAVLTYFKLKMYILTGCFGILISIFIVSPLGYRFFDRISRRIDKAKKKRFFLYKKRSRY